MIHSENPLANPQGVDIPQEVRPTTGGGYAAPELFPDASRYRREDLIAYVERCLVDLAKSGELVLTDVFNQPRDLRDIAGRVLLGHYVDHDDGDRYKADPHRVSPELAGYTVAIRSCANDANGKPLPIAWKKGFEPRKAKVFAATPGGRSGAQGSVRRIEEVRYETGKTEVTLPMHHAWNCLRQHGKYCKRATKARRQAKDWLYVEAAVDDRENPKPKRGRPPKEQ